HATLTHSCWSEAACQNPHMDDFSRLETTIISQEAQRLAGIGMPTELVANFARNQCEMAARSLKQAAQECRIVIDDSRTDFLGRPLSVRICE
ncbi:MAG: hypothetical protein AAF386_14300, partial [Pseudomonadota bacterium]